MIDQIKQENKFYEFKGMILNNLKSYNDPKMLSYCINNYSLRHTGDFKSSYLDNNFAKRN